MGDGIVSDREDKSGLGDSIQKLVNGDQFTRRQVLKGAAAIGGIAALGPIASACGGGQTSSGSSSSAAGTPKKGGDLAVGIVGGSANDTADPNAASYEPDIAI